MWHWWQCKYSDVPKLQNFSALLWPYLAIIYAVGYWSKCCYSDHYLLSVQELIAKMCKELNQKTDNGQTIWTDISKTERDTNDPKKYMKIMHNISNQQENANYNDTELLPHACKNGYFIKKRIDNKCWWRYRKR